MTIEALAHRLATVLAKELSLSDDDRDIAAYALHGIFSVSIYISTLLVTAWIFGLLNSTIIVAATVGIFRTFMGGAHASTAWRCGLIGAVLMNTGALAARYLQNFEILQTDWVQIGGALLLAGIALAAIIAYCPADVPAKPITDPAQRRQLRLISTILVVGVWVPTAIVAVNRGWDNLFFSAFAGLLVQLLLVTPVGFEWSERVDRLVSSVRH